jgi:hypothetical protein
VLHSNEQRLEGRLERKSQKGLIQGFFPFGLAILYLNPTDQPGQPVYMGTLIGQSPEYPIRIFPAQAQQQGQ